MIYDRSTTFLKLYINDLLTIINPPVIIYLFEDDAKLTISFKSNDYRYR